MSLKKIIRNIFRIRKTETFEDGMVRHYFHLRKKLPYRKISLKEFEKNLDKLNLDKKDVLIVHASWRAMYMLEATPEQVINILEKKVGTLVMPCYGKNEEYFNINITTSSAGVLSEVFRKQKGVYRSCFPKFSMAAYGEYAKEITEKHIDSIYQFDSKSPYSIATFTYNAKILLLGMGKKPHKISVFHCASYNCKKENTFYSDCYSLKKHAIVKCNGEEKRIRYFDRKETYSNNKKVFKKLFSKVPHQLLKYKGLTIDLFNAIDAYNIAFNYCQKGGKIYKVK